MNGETCYYGLHNDMLSASESGTSEWVSEQFLNGTSAQLGYTVPFKLDVVKKI